MPPPTDNADLLDPSAKTLHAAALGKLGFVKRLAAKFDDFFTPSNNDFYSQCRYLPLDPRRREFRLLKVHFPARPTVSLQHTSQGRRGFKDEWPRVLDCEIIDKIPLSSNYGNCCAISCAAGSHAQTAEVLVDGFVFKTFANLAHAIHCSFDVWKAHNPGRQFLVWVDQICINQSDPIERGQQVAMMGGIYRHCRETFVRVSAAWTPKDNKPPGFDWMKIQPDPSSARAS
ncbi:hypothetical protein OQA88_10648 [Cercophora sp. LCS_1]